MSSRLISIAFADISAAVGRHSLVATLGWQDVRQRYQRSKVGPFWLTISMGVMIGTIGLVFGQLFRSPIQQFLPFLAAGLILWTYISAVITEGCTGFIVAEGIIKQLPIPLFVHILRMVWRNAIILAHNLVILPLVFLAVGLAPSWLALLSLVGFALLTLNLLWVALMLAVLCARYRDLPQIIASVILVLFYLTPIMWLPHLLPGRTGFLVLTFNPLYHVMEIVRAPLLGQWPTVLNWGASIAMAVVGWLVTLLFYGRYKRRVAYWL
jgi:ABC-type polysaccharide/polyol phosphate export permease